MESLIELCDLIAQNLSQFADKLAWICGRCPPIDSSFGSDSIDSFDFLSYVNKASELSSDFAMAVPEYTGEIVMSAINNVSGDLGVSRVFLNALLQYFPQILPSYAHKLVSTLLDRFEISVPSSPKQLVAITPEASSSQSSPLSANHYQSNERNSPGNEVSNASSSSSGEASRVTDEKTSALSSKGLVMNGGSLACKSNVDIFGAGVGFNDGGGGGSATYKRVVASFEEEPVESLQQQEIAFKLIGTHIG
ncbi:unnamed protein product [Ilex paraguariensis]|uniref:Uncharacterized protein n=1 Tax=Ilex paraguariensis TaxID=185542 RepID=A0ABC8RZ63_9AQUA